MYICTVLQQTNSQKIKKKLIKWTKYSATLFAVNKIGAKKNINEKKWICIIIKLYPIK